MQVNKNEFDDFFGLDQEDIQVIEPKSETAFSSNGYKDYDILTDPEKKEDDKNLPIEEIDLLKNDENKVDATITDDIAPLVNFFQDRIKSGLFSSLVDDEGNDIPLTKKEDIDAFLDANLEYKLEKEKKLLEDSWYQTKSPAWKAIAQYSEYVNDPSELVPFLQGIQNVQSIAAIDETTIEGAEQIIRYKMQLSGDTPEMIDEQVDILKDSDKIVDIATKYKPALVQNETQRLSQMQQNAQKEQSEYIQMVQQYEQAAIKSIETPLFGEKLSQEEKAVIYDLIAVPNQQLGGYPIFAAIDNLYENNDFETLREIGLILGAKQSFYKYASKASSIKTANDLQRKLRVEFESSKKSSGKDDPEVRNVKIPEIKQQGKPRFGY